MATVVRLKRRSDEPPLEGLVLACKRKKPEDDLAATTNEIQFTSVFKFEATVNNQEDVVTHIRKILSKDKHKLQLRHKADVSGKLRAEIRHLAQENRLKVVNCFRHLEDLDVFENETGTEVSNQDGRSFTVLDVVNCMNNGQESNPVSSQSQGQLDPDNSGPETGYVYDLYCTSMAGSDGLVDPDSLLSVHPLSEPNWEYQDPEDSSDMSPEEEDQDDSNDENNWRNDYPDSDHSIDEHDMRMAMQMVNLDLGDGEDLSSDDADEDFIYAMSLDPQDVALYGEGYANYKARMKRELFDKEESEDEDDDPARRFV